MTSTTGILQLLAFAAEPGGGNPAGVVLDAVDLDAAQMQRIATDLGHPETAFVGERDGRRVAVRYFSPGAEVPFCGHATIATAVALAEAEGVGPFTFDTAAGTVEVSTDRDAEGRVTAGVHQRRAASRRPRARGRRSPARHPGATLRRPR
ncbi:PhzF family phenazine biosynthesis protein [Microbacterium testaceum]|uniref:PhzF family phenazine biosynthesis protein n=1 Tax=Microbacterium testaceum TaxID=2033 RepID=UPI0027D7F3C2|nr:PhzF family phenazine biosynthesis isomerase [Microbacterium testaceum]